MTKLSSSYASVTGGVSEQLPADRREGQNWDQVNMLSDPVRGVARRHGSVTVDEASTGAYNSLLWSRLLDQTATYRTYTFFINGHEYDFVYPTKAAVAGLGSSVPFYCIDKDAGSILPVSSPVGDAVVAAIKAGGVSAITNIGAYLFIAGNTVTPAYSTTQKWDTYDNKKVMVAWVRGGAFNRKFSITLTKNDGTQLTVSYTTVSAGYPGTLDTSDLLTTDPDYQKKVNDRTNAYNNAVTAWITSSAIDITPANIATKLKDALLAEDVEAFTIDGSVLINAPDYSEISCDDAGDGTLIRGVGNEVTAPELVSSVHWAGKVVKVRPKHTNGDDALYLEAVPENPHNVGWTQVYWRESAGVVHRPTSVFALATISGGTLHIAGGPAQLDTHLGITTTPKYAASSVGDAITSPIPNFFGERIDYLGDFQDRLVIGSGSTISMSRPGDYFNFFRSSVLTILDTDPIELYALGSEGDRIKSSVTFDRNVILFGERRQYLLNGRQTMTPLNASIVASSFYEDAIDCDPVASGNFVFYCTTRKRRGGVKASLFQVQVGQVADSPESFDLSGQLDQYLDGTPLELVTTIKPNMVALRTSTSRNGLYLYTYLDSPDGSQRLFDSWTRWQWHPGVGYQVGLSRHKGDLLVYMLKEGMTSAGAREIFFSIERFDTSSSLSDKPYLDSLRLAKPAYDGGGFVNRASTFMADTYIALPDGSPKRFIGTGFGDAAAFFSKYPEAEDTGYVGIQFPAYATPTNPYVRDKNGKAVVDGRLTVSRFLVSVENTGGCTITVDDSGGTWTAANFNGRITGNPLTVVGSQPIVNTAVSAAVCRDIREFTFTIKANKWLPLTYTSIEWVGQFFSNARRV